jgi:hypothetical protein
MDWAEITKFIEESGGRAMIIVNDDPAFVVMSYRDYQELNECVKSPMISKGTGNDRMVEKINGLFIDDLPL